MHTLSLLTHSLAITGCALITLTAPLRGHAQQQLIVNGGFETGTFAGFTQANHDNGSFVLLAPGSDTPAVAPDTSTFQTAANPGGGKFFAVTASGNPGTHALLQNFTVPFAVTGLDLSFQMFANDQSGSGPIADSSGLDNRTGGVTDPTTGAPLDNQHARVDILTSGAGDFSTASGDIVDTLYGPNVDNPGGATPNPYLTYTFNLLGVLTPGQTYRLRFAEVDNLGSLNLGVDNISLLASASAAVPEPGSLALIVGLGFSGSLWITRRRSRS